MLDNREIKLVLTALSSHRAHFVKALADTSLEDQQRQLGAKTVKQVDALIKKLAPKLPTNKPKSTPVNIAEQENKPPPKAPAAKPERRKIAMVNAHILIAEDNPDSAMLLKSIVEELGINHIDIASDGREAQLALEKCSPAYDLVLLDWDMPEMNGIEVRQSVRSLAKLRDTHFMMITAVSEAARIKQAIQSGIHDYMVKPVDEDILIKKIKALFLQEE